MMPHSIAHCIGLLIYVSFITSLGVVIDMLQIISGPLLCSKTSPSSRVCILTMVAGVGML